MGAQRAHCQGTGKVKSTVSLGPPGEHEGSDERFDYVLQHYRALVRRTISRVCPAWLGLS